MNYDLKPENIFIFKNVPFDWTKDFIDILSEKFWLFDSNMANRTVTH